ncbi:MAG: ribose 5-phosphate isomerase A [Anaerolineales bacterium]|nr:ribose 5-phosphate isomerase A [Anaerolineales bacterium]
MNLKQLAAQKALGYVESDMVLGIGSGSTMACFVDLLGEKIASGRLRNVVGIPTSEVIARQARGLGIPLEALGEHPAIDLAVDGADEVDAQLDLIKGLGRALLREKVVEVHARRFVVIVDESKLVPRLGTKGALPVEIIKFEVAAHIRWLGSLGCRAELWLEGNGEPIVTDNGNYLARCWFEEGIPDAYQLAQQLAYRPGIVEHGLFLGMASQVIVAGEEGIRILEARP